MKSPIGEHSPLALSGERGGCAEETAKMRYDPFYVKNMWTPLDQASLLFTVRTVLFGHPSAQAPAATNGGMVAVRASR